MKMTHIHQMLSGPSIILHCDRLHMNCESVSFLFFFFHSSAKIRMQKQMRPNHRVVCSDFVHVCGIIEANTEKQYLRSDPSIQNVIKQLQHTPNNRKKTDRFYEIFAIRSEEASCGFNRITFRSLPLMWICVIQWNIGKNLFWLLLISLLHIASCVSPTMASCAACKTTQNDQNRRLRCAYPFWNHMMCATDSMATITHFDLCVLLLSCCWDFAHLLRYSELFLLFLFLFLLFLHLPFAIRHFVHGLQMCGNKEEEEEKLNSRAESMYW